MNKRIYKYPLKISMDQTVRVPKDADFLTIQTQRDQPCIWALVDLDQPLEDVAIRTVGTGHPFEDAGAWQYLGTYQTDDALLVFHVFSQKE